MDIVFLSTEAVPFAKTGGLGDVCGALPATLASRGHNVCLIMPAFASIHACGVPIRQTDISFAVEIRGRVVGARLLAAELPGVVATGKTPPGKASVYFIDQPQFYDRKGLYGDASGDYTDNCERFAFFCRAALVAISRVQNHVDIVHCNDWQTGLVPAYMALGFESHPWMQHARSVFTIHNLAYQGQFWHWDFPLCGLDWQHFTPEGLEFYGGINFLKAGIQFADRLTTVSPTYAQEIQTPLHGCGLDPLLRARSSVLSGITNGIDDIAWNPATDRFLQLPQNGVVSPNRPQGSPAEQPVLQALGNYDVTTWQQGKAIQKRRLQEEFGLDIAPDIPLIGLVGRLADQKGWDLIIEVLSRHLHQNRPVQWAILGTGEKRYHVALAELAQQNAGQFGLRLAFSDAVAHLIEAAADIFLMPSRYEPCGLNQLYSLRYGTVPVVTATGGLVDTVVDATPENLAKGVATGFHVSEFTADQLDRVLGEALRIRYHEKETWEKIVEAGMRQDWSWRHVASQYESLYDEAISLKRTMSNHP
ncbi:MAG TPA: glycogen synthase [Planctomycetaceae bacterium]|nr:glycogen synthase [Planctomycetaceae bacterium]